MDCMSSAHNTYSYVIYDLCKWYFYEKVIGLLNYPALFTIMTVAYTYIVRMKISKTAFNVCMISNIGNFQISK